MDDDRQNNPVNVAVEHPGPSATCQYLDSCLAWMTPKMTEQQIVLEKKQISLFYDRHHSRKNAVGCGNQI